MFLFNWLQQPTSDDGNRKTIFFQSGKEKKSVVGQEIKPETSQKRFKQLKYVFFMWHFGILKGNLKICYCWHGSRFAHRKPDKRKHTKFNYRNHIDYLISDNAVHEAGLKWRDKSPHEGHFFTSIIEDDFRVVRFTPQAVGSHHHGQVISVHFSDQYVLGRHKHL